MVKHIDSQAIEIDRLAATLDDFENMREEYRHNADKLNSLFEMGLIDKDGNPK